VLQRILFVVVLLLVVWRLLVAWGRRSGNQSHGADSYSRFSPNKRRRRRKWSQQRAQDAPEELVACAVCGTFVPTRKALGAGAGKVFCGPACRDRSGVSETNAH